jgi:hypothetical protein
MSFDDSRGPSIMERTPTDIAKDNDSLPPPPSSEPLPNVSDTERKGQLDGVLQSDIGIRTLLTRLKQSISSTKEFANFLKKLASVEEGHAQGLKRLSRSTHNPIRRPENRQDSFAQSFEDLVRTHDRMAEHGLQFGSLLHQMSNDLYELATNIERSRKRWKTDGLAAEKKVQDSEGALDKAKTRYDSLVEQYDRTRTGDPQSGRFGIKGPKSAAQQEEDLQRKVQAADSEYFQKVQTAQTHRQELISTHRPQTVKALQDLIAECDSGLSMHLAKYAAANEKLLLLNNGLCVSPLKSQTNGTDSGPQSLREIAQQVNNEKDFHDYVLWFSNKAGSPPEINYTKHPALAPPKEAQPSHFPSNQQSYNPPPPSFGASEGSGTGGFFEHSVSLNQKQKSLASSSTSESSTYSLEEKTKYSASRPRTKVGQSQNKSISYTQSKRGVVRKRKAATMFTQRRLFSRRLSESRQTFQIKSPAAAWYHWPEKLDANTALISMPLAYASVAEMPSSLHALAALGEYAQVLFDNWPTISSTINADLPITALSYDSLRCVISVMKVSKSSILLLQTVIESMLNGGETSMLYEQFTGVTPLNEVATGGDLTSLVKRWNGEPEDLFRYVQMCLQIIDLAVLSHLYAHAPRAFLDGFEGFEGPIRVPAQPVSTMLVEDVILFQPYRLACLDGLMHKRKVWVFHLRSEKPCEPLYLSSSVEDFAAIWGPLWKVPTSEDDTLIDHFNVGGGQLYPVAEDDSPKSLENERRCHWMEQEAGNSDVEDAYSTSSKESEPDRSTPRHLQQIREAEPLNGSENLLIGAIRSPKLTWYACHCSMSDFKSKMRGSQRLHPLRSRGWFNYVSNTSLGLHLGTAGVVMSGTATRQTDEGQNMKQGFLEEWENCPRSWDPRDLMDFRGVLVSACSFNAQRVRLVELFKTDTLLALIDRCHFSNEHARASLNSALDDADPFAVVYLWERHPDWRDDLGNALLVCIRALCKSGYDTRHELFNVLWKPPRERKLYRLELNPRQHQWLGLLKDSEDSMTMAVLVEDRLAVHCSESCGQDGGPTTLETAIVINRSLSPVRHLEKVTRRKYNDPPPWRSADKPWKYVWKVRGVPSGTSLRLADAGRLRAIRCLTDTHLLLEQTPALVRLIRNTLRIKSGRKDSHWEYGSDNSDDDSAGDDVRPLPVHIQ